MGKLILAELYKESRKKSFKIFILLIIFVSVLSLILINKNLKLESEQLDIYPQYSEEEYLDVNKYGSYSQYLKDYENYKSYMDKEIVKSEVFNKTKINALYIYYPTFLFVIGLVSIFISFNILSYDYQSKSLRYVFQSHKGRNKILISKVITVILLSIFYSFLLFLTFLFTLCFLTKENLLLETIPIYLGNSLKYVPIVLYYLFKTFLYIIPITFISIFTVFLTIFLKGNTFALIISNIVYFCSLLVSQILITYGYTFIRYSFLPYLDFTYFENSKSVILNNLIYNLDLSIEKGFIILIVYSTLFFIFSIKFIKRDV